MARHFLAGLAAEPGVLGLLLGGPDAVPARAEGLALATSERGPWAVAVPGAGCDGVVVEPDAEGAARLAYALESLGLMPRPLAGLGATGWVGRGLGPAGPLEPWALQVMLTALGDILALRAEVPAAVQAGRLQSILVRAASRLRAEGEVAPARLRHAARAGDVAVAALRQPYGRFFAVEEYDVSWRRFDGTMSETVTRAAFLSGDAVTVLPYDPARDRVLIVEQFRAGPLARGGRECWQFEAIAGRVDPFETPETAARREAVEEAGLVLDRLLPVGRYYPSPGAVGEFIFSYVALADLPDGTNGVFGEADEAEDIRGHLVPFATLMELVASGEIENAPLILTALWLERERGRLRG